MNDTPTIPDYNTIRATRAALCPGGLAYALITDPEKAHMSLKLPTLPCRCSRRNPPRKRKPKTNAAKRSRASTLNAAAWTRIEEGRADPIDRKTRARQKRTDKAQAVALRHLAHARSNETRSADAALRRTALQGGG